MRNETPLRLEYEPDDYLCTWDIPDGKGGSVPVAGNLDVRPKAPPEGTIYGSIPLEWQELEGGQRSVAFPRIVHQSVLSGTLANGGQVHLLDAELRYWKPGGGRISGSAALMGRGSALFGLSTPPLPGRPGGDATSVSAVKVQIAGLDSILGAAPIQSVQTPLVHPDNPRNEWTAVLNVDADREWRAEGVAMSVGYHRRSRDADAYEFRLAFSPVATFSLDVPITLRAAIDDLVEPLRRIISIATGEPRDLTYVAASLQGSSGWFQVYGTGITQAPVASSSEWLRKNGSAVSVESDQVSLLDLVDRWRVLAAEHHPLIETYGAMLHAGDQHPRSRFLLLIQALEGLYGYDTRAEFQQRKERHLAKREAALLAAKDALVPGHIRFLKRALLKTPPASLEDALLYAFRDLPVDVSANLAETDLVRESRVDPQVSTSTVGALRVVRNNLAHGNRGYDEDSLDEVVSILERVVRVHALRTLNCPDSAMTRIFRKN